MTALLLGALTGAAALIAVLIRSNRDYARALAGALRDLRDQRAAQALCDCDDHDPGGEWLPEWVNGRQPPGHPERVRPLTPAEHAALGPIAADLEDT